MTNNDTIIKQLSEREQAIIQFIHEFGFCEIQHIMQGFKLGRSTCYGQMKMLIRLGMINHAMVLPNQPGVYFLTTKAVRSINSDLPPVTQIPRNAYIHHMTVLNVYLKLREKYLDSVWITERRLIRQKHDDMTGQKDHLPDGIFVFPEGRRIAIEVELSLKSRERLMSILTDYAVDDAVYGVWYFCAPKILPVLQEIAIKLNKIKIHLLDEGLI